VAWCSAARTCSARLERSPATDVAAVSPERARWRSVDSLCARARHPAEPLLVKQCAGVRRTQSFRAGAIGGGTCARGDAQRLVFKTIFLSRGAMPEWVPGNVEKIGAEGEVSRAAWIRGAQGIAAAGPARSGAWRCLSAGVAGGRRVLMIAAGVQDPGNLGR